MILCGKVCSSDLCILNTSHCKPANCPTVQLSNFLEDPPDNLAYIANEDDLDPVLLLIYSFFIIAGDKDTFKAKLFRFSNPLVYTVHSPDFS